jgi:hypothetical protein
MKLYRVEFNADYSQISENKKLNNLHLKWRKDSSYPGHKYNPKTEEDKLKQNKLKEAWEALPLKEAMKKYPNKVELDYGEREQILSLEQYESCYSYCTIKQILDLDAEAQVHAIDLDKLASKIKDSLIGSNGDKLFNNRLEIHQPDIPLFTYNRFIHLDDCCTDILQEDYINKGYRVVACVPQPDQRRPDYILGKYVKEEND